MHTVEPFLLSLRLTVFPESRFKGLYNESTSLTENGQGHPAILYGILLATQTKTAEEQESDDHD